MTAIPESITEAELAAAFGRLPLPGLYGGGKMAASLVADVLAHREPEYEPGEAYAEGPQSAKPIHFDVLAEIVTGLGRDETGKQLADRICMLMGASDEH